MKQGEVIIYRYKKLRVLIVLLTLTFSGCIPNPSATQTSKMNKLMLERTPDMGPSLPENEVNDPLSSQAWHLNNTAQKTFAYNPATAGEDINYMQTYNLGYRGRGVRIAISDDGVQTDHEDLKANFLTGEHRSYKGCNSSCGDRPQTSKGEHGTAVTGIIVAQEMNGIGSRGVAPNAKYAAFQYIGSNDTSAALLDQTIGNFDIFNYSYGYQQLVIQEFNQELERTYAERISSSLYVKAAGNDYDGFYVDYDEQGREIIGQFVGNSNHDTDNNTPYTINVGALNANGESSSYSSPGVNLWISAPGGEYGMDGALAPNIPPWANDPAILTTDVMGCDEGLSITGSLMNDFDAGRLGLNSNCNYTATMNGTSSAAPMVSGAIALMLEANPNLTWRQIKYILAITAKKPEAHSFNTKSHPLGGDLSGHVYARNWVTNDAGLSYHYQYGFGALDVDAAVDMAVAIQNDDYTLQMGVFENLLNTSGNFHLGPEVQNLPIPDADANGVSSTYTMTENLFIEAVQIQVSIDHPFMSDIGIELISPKGTESKIIYINSLVLGPAQNNMVFLTNAFYMEQSAGEWTLKIIDGALDDSGTLIDWKINVYGTNQILAQ